MLIKGVGPAELLDAIRTVAHGESLLSRKATQALITQLLDQPAPVSVTVAASLAQLTDREREIVAPVGEGLSNDEIAQRLFVSPLTVKTHISRAMTKLQARDRAQLVMLAYRSGLMRPAG